MLYEFAIEPAVLAGWDKCRNVLNLMGFRHGRAIAAYPSQRRWARFVLDACKRTGCKDRELARITEKLFSTVVKNKLLHAERKFDDGIHPEEERWLKNALSQQSTPNAFHAILASQNVAGRPDVIAEEDVDESHPKLNVPREELVLREANALAAFVRRLVCNSNSLVLVDPHFEPWLYRWRAVVKACLTEAAQTGRTFDRVEIHVLETDANWSFADFEKKCHENVKRFVPDSLKRVRVVRWRLKGGGVEDFHERYLLTNRGGYKLGKGFDEEVGVTQPVGLLDDHEWQRLWKLFGDASTGYDKVGEMMLS